MFLNHFDILSLIRINGYRSVFSSPRSLTRVCCVIKLTNVNGILETHFLFKKKKKKVLKNFFLRFIKQNKHRHIKITTESFSQSSQ